MTRRHSNNQRSGGTAAHPTPKKFRVLKSAGKFLASIFWDQDGILLIDFLPKGQTINTEYYSSLPVQLKDILKENAAGRSLRVSCSCTTMPRLTGHLQPRRNWPTSASNVLITHPPYSPDLAPSDYHLLPGLKKQLKGRHFSSMWRSLLSRRPGWTDNLLNFFFF